MSWNSAHDFNEFDLAVFVVNGVPRVQGSPGGKITSIGDLQVRYFQPGGVPVESGNYFPQLSCILGEYSSFGKVSARMREVLYLS